MSILINEIVIKAELSEQRMDDLFFNSLFVEDSLIDNYTDDDIYDELLDELVTDNKSIH